MKVVTLRNLSPDLARVIRRKADERRASIAKTVISMLEESAGLGKEHGRGRVYHDLDALSGSWARAEGEAFSKALAAQRVIDPELWT